MAKRYPREKNKQALPGEIDMDDLFDDEVDEEEYTRESAKALFDRLYDELDFLQTVYPKDYKFCFNRRRDIDEIVYSYLDEENQKLLCH